MIRGKTFKAHDIIAIQKELKTQFRVVVKPQPHEDFDGPGWFYPTIIRKGEECPGKKAFGIWGDDWSIKCPYAVGDVIYAKETWRFYGRDRGEGPEGGIEYRSDLESRIFTEFESPDKAYGEFKLAFKQGKANKWKSSTQLPQWAARFWEQITEVRCERLQDISEEDAIAEGLESQSCGTLNERVYKNYEKGQMGWCGLLHSFSSLWDSIYGETERRWQANPWVFVYTFKGVEKP